MKRAPVIDSMRAATGSARSSSIRSANRFRDSASGAIASWSGSGGGAGGAIGKLLQS